MRRLAGLGEPDGTSDAYQALRRHARDVRGADAWDEADRWEHEAESLVRYLIDRTGETERSLNALASVLRNLDRPDEAWLYNARSLELDGSPDSNRAAWTTRGALLRQRGDLAEAFETLQAVWHRHQDDAKILRALIAVCAVIARRDANVDFAALAAFYAEKLAELPGTESDPLAELHRLVRRAKTDQEREALQAVIASLDAVPPAPNDAGTVVAPDGMPF